MARSYRFNTAAIVFDVPIEVCMKRNAARMRRVPQGALMTQRELLDTTLTTIHQEGFDYVHILDDAALAKVAIKIGRYVSRPARRPPR